jgi:SRSO17 transposase
MSDIRRRNSWQLAEVAGKARPDGMQRLLNGSRWDQDGMRDAIQSYALDTLETTDAVLIVDETGFLKKGTCSAGVKRQYSGTAGRIENCQIGVFLTYTTCEGQALVDRDLYLPKEWIADSPRRQKAGIPETVSFQTKPQLAQDMIERAIANGLAADWITGDSIYGSARSLRVWLEQRRQPFVLGVKSDEALWCGLEQVRATQL